MNAPKKSPLAQQAEMMEEIISELKITVKELQEANSDLQQIAEELKSQIQEDEN